MHEKVYLFDETMKLMHIYKMVIIYVCLSLLNHFTLKKDFFKFSERRNYLDNLQIFIKKIFFKEKKTHLVKTCL